MSKIDNTFALARRVAAERPDLEEQIEKALFGPDGKGPTKEFCNSVEYASRGYFSQIERLLQREPAEIGGNALDRMKAKEFTRLRPYFAYLERYAEGNKEFLDWISLKQDELVESDLEDFCSVRESVEFVYFRCASKELILNCEGFSKVLYFRIWYQAESIDARSEALKEFRILFERVSGRLRN